MGLTKTENFTDEQNELANIARVLAHPARIAIIQYLLKINQCIGGEIVEEIPLAQPTISRHLKELKSMGIIQGTVEGKSVCYCVNPTRWREIQGIFTKLFETK
ncbi:MAG: metalloregulator ArsR/SmtB family transcription factor [Bacteroidota bacterium]